MAAPTIEGHPEFVRVTRSALALLQTHDPQRASLVNEHIARITGLGYRDVWRLGRAILYGPDRQALTSAVRHAWVDRRQRHCFVAPSIWHMEPGDGTALRRYASVLVHEAAHLYLDTQDEAACNAEMQAAQTLLTPAV